MLSWNNLKERVKKYFPGLWTWWHKMKYFYIVGTFNLLTGRKAVTIQNWARCREVCADPNNRFIPRVKQAGKTVDGCIVMHNGLLVNMTDFAYYNNFSRIVLTRNKGVHEPQEERMFQEVLKHIPCGAVMIEFGAYWAFYSMWFKKAVKEAHCFMIEPEEHNLRCGQENFRLNGMTGTFIRGKAGCGGILVDDFIERANIQTLHILHADIQGFEMEMLRTCKKSFAKNKIWYVFISTHSQQLHYECESFLAGHGFEILASADFNYGTYCSDGVLVARCRAVKGVEKIDIALRRQNQPEAVCSGSSKN